MKQGGYATEREARRGHRALRSLNRSCGRIGGAEARTSEELDAALRLRERVFVDEQGVSPAAERTAAIAEALHVRGVRRRAPGRHLPPDRGAGDRAAPRADGGGARRCAAAGSAPRSWPRPSARRCRAGAETDAPARAARAARRSTSAPGYEAAGRGVPRGGHRARDDGDAACLSCGSTRSHGLRVIVAGERGERPGVHRLQSEPRPPIDPETDPFLEGHEDRTPPEVFAAAARRRRARLARAGGCGWCRTCSPRWRPARPRSPIRSAGGRGEPDLFAARPASGAHEVVVNGPGAGVVAARPRARRPGRRRWASGASGCASTPAPATCT